MDQTTDAAMTLLLTRPVAQSERFLAILTEALGARPPAVISPLAEMLPTGAVVPAKGALALTSGRAVEAAGEILAGRVAYCVGARTAELARQAGAKAISADGDAEALLALIMRQRPDRVIHLRGDHQRGDLVARLRLAGVEADELELYRTRDLPLTTAARRLLDGRGRILAPVFSPRSAARLAEAAGPALARMVVAAISPAAAAPLAGAQYVEFSEAPNAEALAALTLRLWRGLP